MGSEEGSSRFGEAQASKGELEAGGIAWRDGTMPAVVVSVNEADEGDDVSVTIAPLVVETVHVSDLATEYVDPAGVDVAIPAPPVVPAGAQVPADDSGRQTTPTGEPVAGGTATAPVQGAEPQGAGPGAEREAEQERRIAELEGMVAELRSDRPREAPMEPLPPEVG